MASVLFYPDPAHHCWWYQDEEVRLAITDHQLILDMDLLMVCRPTGHVTHFPAAGAKAHYLVVGGPLTCFRTLHTGPTGRVTCDNRMRPMTAAEHAAYLLGGEEALRGQANP